ncbi:hypothetical protein BCR35DRAFT_306317 [Leucosporidium creatinivorum]|uniref:Zn(2)-C6 fungal-type domain-containing protein n=1 Tax=Leucosporidium creatinivorum TaxID=106004 RepID=A0A1Y2EUV7_9BASI|nr:hypothetical protein BCR35DRAFT_306317 [Leucosporidium creatinivorum]
MEPTPLPAFSSAPPAAPAPSSQRPVRAMLARGAACDLCRARKVKCDGARPICAQCLKSAKGNADACNCVYEGAGTVAKGAVPVPKKRPSATRVPSDGGSSVEKRGREGDDEEGDQGGARKKGGQRIETLVDRITELEDRLRAQAQAQSFPISIGGASRPASSYPASFAPAEQAYTNPLPAQQRPSMSYPTSTSTSAYTAPTSFYPISSYPPAPLPTTSTTAAVPAAPSPGPWAAQESSVREEAQARPASEQSSIGFTGLTASASGLSSAQETSFAGSSYPPLNYAPDSSSNAMASGLNGYVPSPSESMLSGLSNNNLPSESPVDFTASDFGNAPSARVNPATNGFNSSSSAGGNSLAPSPDDSLGLDAAFLQILYPAWPSTLPSPSIVAHLVHIFFARATIPAAMFNKGRFLASMELAPTAAGFPETALLHAMCGYAALLVSEETLSQRDEFGRKYWEGAKGPREYHYACARADIDRGVLSKTKTFQILQATILCCYIAYQAASFTELWLLSGTATRLCTPLGLNHLPPYDYCKGVPGAPYPDWSNRIRMTPSAVTNSILPPPKDQEEYFERTVTFWTAFAIDRHASASTDWSTSIDEQDISTHLPCFTSLPNPSLQIDPLQGRIHTLSLKDPDFLHETTAPIGSLGLYIKGNVLLGRVINWTQRLPRYAVAPEGETCTTMKIKIKESAEFKELDFALSKFRTTVSGNFIDAGNQIDGYLASSYAIPHVATILLHEPFTDRHDQSPNSSLAKCLTSAKCVVNSVYAFFGMSNDLAGVDPFLCFSWSVVGRALVRDHAVRRLWGDMEQAAASRSLAESCLALVANCSKAGVGISVALSESLRDLLNNPNRVLPPDGTEEGLCLSDPRNHPQLNEVPITIQP